MKWYVPWPESLKKRACRYLLQRYLGQFLEEKLTLDQLSVDLYNGTGTVADVSLDVQALNELGEQQNWPMEFVDGYIEQISISIPWSAILKDSSFVEVHGFTVTIQPKHRTESATSMFESMWESMTSSMQLAQECLKQDATNLNDGGQPLEGIERFAQTIDSILSRVKVRFVNTVIRLEHVPKESTTGVAMQINIQNMEYLDEAGSDPPTGESILSNQEQNKAYVVSSFTTKKFYLEGVTFHTDEFPSRARTFSKSVTAQSQSSPTQEKHSDDSIMSQLLDEKHKENRDSECEYYMSESDAYDQPNTLTADGLINDSSDRQLIIFGKLSGRQEIRLRLKQSEAIAGPKVSLDVTFGSMMLFLSPRQVHVLLELANGLASPDIEDTSNVAPRQRCTEKPMDGLDYQRIEQELQQQLHPLATFQQSQNLQHTQGWSTAALEDSDNDGDFLPMRCGGSSTNMVDSAVSGASSSMDSSMSSSMASSVSGLSSQRSPRRASNIDNDPAADITHFQIRLASFALVILHEDLLTLAAAEQDKILVPSSVIHMKHTAETFFNKLGLFAITSYGNKDFENAKAMFEKACQLNHLRLLGAPVQIEGDEKTTLTATSKSGNLTIAKLELLECLWDKTQGTVEYIKLLHFPLDETIPAAISTKPSLKVAFKHYRRAVKTGLTNRVNVPKTDVVANLNVCTMEIDITIVDRISALLNPQPVCDRKGKTNPQTDLKWNKDSKTQQTSKESDYRLDLKIMSPTFKVKLRFPIPDFRPHHDMQRNPWWKRSVRPDYVTLEMNDVTAHTNLHSRQPFEKYVLQCKTVNVSYFDGDSSIPIGKAGVDDKYSLREGFNWPRLVLQVYPILHPNVELEDHEDVEMSQYSQYYMEPQIPRQPGPFSAKKVVHESDTPHTKPQQEDTEELIIPGNKKEMNDFIDFVMLKCRIRIDITLPTLSLQLVSKHIYELLYNRINTDLLLWEPSAPKCTKTSSTYENLNYGSLGTDMQESIYPMFSMCKSGIQYNSDESDESESSDPSETSIFYSVYESKKLKQKRKIQQNEQNLRNGQSAIVLNTYVGYGSLGTNTPVRDGVGNVIPSHHGEFLIVVEDAHIFSVSGFQGDDDLGYVCVQAKSGNLYHCDMTGTPSQNPPIREIGSSIARHLHPTVYKSERGVLIGCNERGNNRDMISVAIRIQASHETHHVKTVRVAIGINKATLRHRMCPEPNSFISQLKDFFNVLDYPIPGYHAKDVLIELHLHLWDCAIDYRPLYLPLRTAVTMGSFSMSSHLAAQANTSTLRFIAEECSLLLSEKAPPRSGTASIAEVDLKRDYVGVIDLGLFELSLRTSDKKCGMNPHFDLRASNNIVHIRTCADTGRSLMQLITYFASDGDLGSKESICLSASNVSSPRHQPEQELVSVEPQDISNLSKSQHQHVNDLLGEAMKESLNASVGTNSDLEQSSGIGGAQVFYFPDENNPLPGTKLPVQVTKDLGDVDVTYHRHHHHHHHHLINTNSNKSSDTDDDFCFVGNEAGLGILPKSGVPEIRWLTDDPVRVIDNHFSIPVGKTDLLKPPKHYPVAVERYTLCEMTLIWHLYGGNDFKSLDDEKSNSNNVNSKKTVNFSDINALSKGVTYSKSTPGEVSFSGLLKQEKKLKMSWQEKGGLNRDHDVLMELQLNKVKFQHEEYPKETVQASRQVLLISELEIRDRLASSHINKFLYQHTCQARPKQSHAHMIVIKAVHVRPDPKLQRQECCLKVSLLPLRLNIDQDALLFLIDFFTKLGDTSLRPDEETPNPISKHNTPTHQPPVMTISMENQEAIKEQAKKMVMDNLILLEEDSLENNEHMDVPNSQINVDNSPPIYFRSVIFSPEVPIRLDYQGKQADILSNPHGPLAGLLLGLAQLHCSELRLKRLSHRHGLLGADKLVTYALQEWLSDIKKNQLPSLLGGVGPMHSLVQLFQGIRDLFWLPIEQYQKDGRIVRGLQRGANSFTTSTAMAALELTSRIIHLIQATAETAYDMVSPGPSVRKRARGTKGRRKRYTQPQDIREGMANAYMLVKEGIGETADNLVRVASQEHEQKGYSGAVGGVLRQIPPTFVKPIIIASEATNNVLGGMRSQLVPDARREANQKWRDDDG